MTAVAPETSDAAQDYAKAIYSLHARRGEPVSTSAIADRMGVSPASASAMVKRLAEQGLVEHVPYKGVEPTKRGARLALEVLRHHRLLELYLAERLDVPWDQVHEAADALEHAISEDLEERIAAKLDHPTHDPHGAPIPTADLAIEQRDTRSLDSLEVGARGHFVEISDSRPEMLRYLRERGIEIGKRLEIIDRQPFDGPLTVRFGNTDQVLGGMLAKAMRVEVTSSQA